MELKTAIEGIMKLRKTIHEQNLWNNPNHLSDVMVKLSVYNAYLADHLAGLHQTASDSAVRAFQAARDMEVGVTEAERLAKAESLKPRKEFEHTQYIYKSTGSLISVLQSRLRVIESQLKQEGIQ